MEYLDDLDDFAIQALAEMGVTVATPVKYNDTESTASAPGVRVRRPKIWPSNLLRLEHPLPTARDVANALKLPRVPKTESGLGEQGEAQFCVLEQPDIDTLDTWISKNYPRQRWTKVRLSMAHKSQTLPILGRDPTLPQNRPSTVSNSSIVSDAGYPIWYFFYGTLSDKKRLSRLFEVPEWDVPDLEPAILKDGCIRMWADKYRALADCAGGNVEGFACLIQSKEEEEALRRYEGHTYEVVQARFMIKGREVYGRTFRFAGYEDELSI
jgi:hypothetical protein